MSYALHFSSYSDDPTIVRLSDTAFIPAHEGNKDYQEYLEWVAEGNVAEEWQEGF